MAAMTGKAIREALEPFARAATGVGAIYRDEDCVSYTPHVSMILTVGDLRRARAAYDAIGAGSGVKALPWAKRPNGRDWFAATEVGQYVVGEIRDEYKAFLRRVTDDGQDQDIVVGKASTESEAKAAAQADFERRVLSCLSTHTAAGAGPVGEAVAFRKGADTVEDGSDQAIYGIDMLTNEQFTAPWWGNRIEIYGKKGGEKLRDRILAFLTARPVEEPGEVERLTRERDEAMEREVKRAVTLRQRIDDMRCEIAEIRKHLEKLLEAAGKARTALAGFTSADDAAFALDVAISEIKRVAGHPVEEPDEVAHASAERAETAESALVETRERLEKVEAALREIADGDIGILGPEAHARAALTGDAQEARR